MFIAAGRSVRKVTPDGNISTIAGSDLRGNSGDGGPAVNALFNSVSGLALDARGNLYVSDGFGSVIRRIAPDGIISTFAGTGVSGFAGDGGPATRAQLVSPGQMAFDPAGNLYVATITSIRKITPDGIISSFAAGTGVPFGLATDALGNVYCYLSGYLRRYTPAGVGTILAGTGTQNSTGDGGPARSAAIHFVGDLAVDSAGNIFLTETNTAKLRKIDAQGNITTIAGTGVRTATGDGGPAVWASIGFPTGLWLDARGRIHLADAMNGMVRLLTPVP